MGFFCPIGEEAHDEGFGVAVEIGLERIEKLGLTFGE